ncbi:MAG: hypothetical protein IKK59_07970 [Lachnospiraceae bacterium]|nr:hypothetical protein [Lachnospiraceae bacterium]
MMKKRMKQFMALALSAVMLVGAAGCGSETTGNNSNESQTAVETSETQITEETQDTVVNEDITYPLDTDVELSVWHANFLKPNEAYASYAESPFHRGLEDKTGVKIDWQHPATGTDVPTAFNLLLTEKELPDILFLSLSPTQGQQMIDDGAIYDLTEYLPKYAPDYWATVTQPQYEGSFKSMFTSDGKLYCVGSFVEEAASITYMGPIVRKDWLDECGLDIPETIEEWNTMLTAFKEKYDCTPMAMRLHQLLLYDNVASATNAYTSMPARFYVKDGKIGFANVEPEWKEYVTLMNEWYTGGILDKDSVTMDNNAVRAKAIDNKVGVTFGALSFLNDLIKDAEAENTGAEWVAIGYPRVSEGAPVTALQSRANHWNNVSAVITTSCPEEELITALQWLNYGYTEEGAMYWNYGDEGVSYTLNAEGQAEFTDIVKNDPAGLNSGITKYTGVASNGLALQDFNFLIQKNGEAGGNALNVWTENSDAQLYYIPSLSLTEEESTDYTDAYASISSYVAEMGQKFMTGEVAIDKFDEYVKTLYDMGLQKCIDIQQAAYDRFMATEVNY